MSVRFILPFADVGDGVSPSDGATLDFFITGTSTRKDTFSDEALATPNANPVVADADGLFSDIWVADGSRYKVVLKDKNGVQQWESDPVVGGVSVTGVERPFDTVALMVADTGLNIGDIVQTAGYTTKGDGGDNRYEIVAAATGTDDGGSFIDLVTHQAKGLFPGNIINIKQYGTTGSGDGAAASAALNNHSVVWLDGDIAVDASVVVSSPVIIKGMPGHKIIPSLGLTGGKLFAFETDTVTVEDVVVDGAGETFTPATGNTYAFFSGDGVTKYYNHNYINPQILNMSFSDGNAGATNLLVSHGIYVDNVDDLVVDDSDIDTISGACVFLRDVKGVTGSGNKFEDFRWYACNLDEGVSNGFFTNTTLISGTAEGCFWGGGLNTVSDNGTFTAAATQKVKNMVFDGMHFEGAYSYGAMIRLQSSDDITVKNVTGTNLSMGTAGIANQDFTGVRILTRGADASNKQKPGKNITIDNISLDGPSGVDGKRHFIYADNNYWSQITTGTSTISVVAAAGTFTRSAGSYVTDGFEVGDKFTPSGNANAGNNKTRTISAVSALVITTTELTGLIDETGDADEVIVTNNYLTNISIKNCKAFSPNTTNYWEDGAIFHGLNGGIDGINHEDNYYEVRSATSPAVNGAIGHVANAATGNVINIREGGNHVIEMGTPSASYHLGIGYDAYCDQVIQTKPNIIDNFFYGVRTLTNAGPTLDKIDDNLYLNIDSLNELYAVNPSRYGLDLTGSVAFDPPSIAAGAATFKDVTVTGAAVGDFVLASFSLDQALIDVAGYVRTANSVRVTFSNHTAGAIDLGSGTLFARVLRK